MLEIWPVLPIFIFVDESPPLNDGNNVVAAFEKNDRIRKIHACLTNGMLDALVEAIQNMFLY